MRFTLRLQKPDDLEATVTLTMKVGEWRELRDQLNGKWPSSKLTTVIDDMVGRVETTFYGEEGGT